MSDKNDDAMFSRSGNSCVLGKCTEDIKSKLPEEVKEQISALATINGQTVSEYLRDMCIERVFGHVFMLRAKMGNGMPGIGPK